MSSRKTTPAEERKSYVVFDEVLITFKGKDGNGKRRQFKMREAVDGHSLHISNTRPFKVRRGRPVPSEYVFHVITFITKSKY